MSTGAAITLAAVGDISFADNAISVGHGVRTQFERVAALEPLYPFTHVSALFTGADVVFGNLETVISDAGRQAGRLESLEMRGCADGATRLRDAGFSVINVANNHILQHGAIAFEETVQNLQREGLAVVGLARPDRRGTVRRMVQTNGLRLAFLGYAFEPDRYFFDPPLYAFGPTADIAADVRAARADADVVICSVHWGDEFVRYPSPDEVSLGHAMIDAGAHLVLGHHPHVLRGVERYKEGVIAYSLGNFVFDMPWDEHLRRGAVLFFTIGRNGIVEVRPEFVWIGDDYQPRPVDGFAAEQATRAWADVMQWATAVPARETYNRDRVLAAKTNRYQSWRYFSRTLFRRQPGMTAQMLTRTARRKMRIRLPLDA